MNFNELNNQSTVYVDSTLQTTTMRHVFTWMFGALGITALTAMLVAKSSLIYTMIMNPGLLWGLIIAELALVFILSARIGKMSFFTSSLLFTIYSILNGVTLSSIFIVYTMTSIAATFFITAGMFGAMALWGYFTKKDLSKWGSIFFMLLIGLILATVVNLFLRSGAMGFIISIVGVIIFTGLTAFDVNKIKQMLAQMQGFEEGDVVRKVALMGALTLYLDFINLFLYLLRFFGRRD
ncbi:FtsH-interacting integral membrane protein [Porphyromonas gingivalis AJW4]|uniref:Bax inhibitor-1/YccA family protein n=1 Tax=Porphyromonas gingivalis TaxID=837 RepID=UPI00020F029F|nr:Bax inhibitor-1/YccA family protein [Porphyromonas gingivalis]EOA10499.1 inhibitor of apoptosis-promoting Bax1 [Porphyromonas gingivalis JCVI SC001]ALA93648.1 FtsH-interacting integral membrane protein [Porphyromonas gingivalis AJW4]ATR93765.1 BAX inhibitor (BI)-1/YccA family protein [Porphyromonas gingivalis]ATR96925.1 BAX inhibitor (BI)-1/YccA family protein [Porphyromonas gingivalis]ATR98291.1 BAX inhibitor (BI)-1/YccA family protein [Porphyromonas gingivalis]